MFAWAWLLTPTADVGRPATGDDMSRTFRKIPGRRPIRVRGRRPGGCRNTRFIQKVPDGIRNMTVELKRDDRVTGLRDHKLHRARARQKLRTTDDDVRAGKLRRYGDTYGEYLW